MNKPIGIYRSLRPLVLASSSPRRRELLASLGIEFTIRPSLLDEPAPEAGLSPVEHALDLARLKARDVASTVREEMPGAAVLGADTIVVLGPDVLGKPGSSAQARKMLTRLAGVEHKVVTGCCLVLPEGGEQAFHTETRVRMRAAGQAEIEAYVATGEPMDKAGAYAIQGLAACLVEWVEGSYTNVVGLPLARVLEALLQESVVTPATR